MFKINKMTKLLAVVMAVAMMFSVCMVEAFAALIPEQGVAPCASGTFQGYYVNANFARASTGTQMNCLAQCGISMGIYAKPSDDTLVQVKIGNTYKYVTVYQSGTYYGYDVTIPIPLYGSQSSAVVQFAQNFPVIFGYNGQEYPLNTTTRMT